MRYPNGKIYQDDSSQAKYKEKHPTKTQFGKRGMRLETMLNASNQWYRLKKRAVIHKKPTPIQVVAADYPSRSKVRITEAYYRQASTTDYNGVYQGFYLDFEAKQTKQTTRFPLNNFHQHQIEHMLECVEQSGICFAIILFSQQQEVYLYPIEELVIDWHCFEQGERSSIPYQRVKTMGIPIPFGIQPELDYLKAVDQYIERRMKDKGSERCE